MQFVQWSTTIISITIQVFKVKFLKWTCENYVHDWIGIATC